MKLLRSIVWCKRLDGIAQCLFSIGCLIHGISGFITPSTFCWEPFVEHFHAMCILSYRLPSNIRRTLVGNTFVDHPDVLGAACRRCSNYIFILDLTPGFNGLRKDNCKARREWVKFWDLVRVILRDFTVRNSVIIKQIWIRQWYLVYVQCKCLLTPPFTPPAHIHAYCAWNPSPCNHVGSPTNLTRQYRHHSSHTNRLLL